MINRHPVQVTIPDKSAELPPELQAGTRVRIASTHTTGVVIRAEQDRGGIYILVRVAGNGSLRCIPPNRLVVLEKRDKRRTARAAESPVDQAETEALRPDSATEDAQ